MNSSKIDIVIPWVDSNDPSWREEKNRYALTENHPELVDDSDARFRDWDTVRYLFRGIDLYMPWVDHVFFVTWGHVPSWMNVHADKLRIIRHDEYIPEKYLPTFCSHTIELNLHRIKDLAEQFVYFNDDLLILKPFQPEDFFLKGLPRDYAIINPLISSHRFSVQDVALTDIEVINDHFNKTKVIRNHPWKWLTPVYGKELFRSLCLMQWPKFAGLFTKHQCNAFLKSTFEEVWEKEYDLLDSTCSHKFRTRRDVNQWLMRYWQLASGHFYPIKPYGKLYGIKNDNSSLYQAIQNNLDRTICINDNNAERILDFEKTKEELIRHLEQRFGTKSSFEL